MNKSAALLCTPLLLLLISFEAFAQQAAEQPAEQTAEQPTEQTAEQPAEQTAEQTAEQPAEQTAEQAPTEMTGERSAAQLQELTLQVEELSQTLERLEAAQAAAEVSPAQGEPEIQLDQQSAPPPPLVSYDPATGLHIRPAPERFELTMRGFLWGRYTYVPSGNSGEKARLHSFSLPQGRLKFVASMAGGLVAAVFQPSFAPGWAGIQDGYVELRLAPWANIRVGKQLVNYDWESNTAPPVMPVVGLSPLVGFFGHGRDLGVMFHGTAAGRLHYRLGAFNGSRTSTNEDRNFLIASMVRYQIIGKLAPGWGWTDLFQSRDFNATVGVGGTYEHLNDALPAATTTDPSQVLGYGAHQWQATGHLHLRYYGVSLVYVLHGQGRYHELNQDELATAEILGITQEDSVYSLGNLIHLGYVPWKERLEIFGRMTYLDHDLGEDSAVGLEAMGGLSLFLLGQNAKLTAQYAYQRALPSGPHGPSAEDAHVVAVQAQGWF